MRFFYLVVITQKSQFGNDSMQFDVKSFNASAGSDFKLTFKNTGKLPKIAMGHNLVILKKEYLQLSSDKKSYLVEAQMHCLKV